MSNETMPERIWVMRTCWSEEKNSLRLDPPPPEVSYTRTDGETITELRRQNAALKEFVKRILMVDLDTCDVHEEAIQLGVLKSKKATEDDVNTGNADEIGEDVSVFTDWMLTDAAAMPAPSKAEVAREFVEQFKSLRHNRAVLIADEIGAPRPSSGGFYDGEMEELLKEWEDAESK